MEGEEREEKGREVGGDLNLGLGGRLEILEMAGDCREPPVASAEAAPRRREQVVFGGEKKRFVKVTVDRF